MSKDKLIPELRFPEFKNEGEWAEVEFGKLKLDVSDGNYSSKYPSQSDFLKSGVPFIRSNNLKNGTVVDEDMRFISEKQHSEITKGHLKEGDILLSTRGELGTVALVPKKHIGSNINAQLVRINTSNILSNTFLFYLFELSRLNKIFDSLSTGTALKQLPIGKLNQLKLLLPKNKSEQLKIASCLSSLDEVIAAHSQKLELLKDHKKGLMQNLFPQEGEKVPKYRFKEFEDDGEWVEKTINKLVPQNEKYGIVDGPFGSNLKTIHYKTEGIPIITSGYVTDGVFKADKYLYVTEEKYNEEKRSSVKGGDIVMAKIGARCGASAIMPENHRIGILSGNALKITIDKSEHSTNFIWQQLWHLHSNDKFSGIKSIGAQPAISMDSLKKFELTIPPRIEEQQKIASCLSSLDALITAQAEKIEQLKLHKKGLMQGLFPKINE